MTKSTNIRILWAVVLFFGVRGTAQSVWPHGRLKVSPDGHYLQYEDGAPFFWLGDTGWELFHRLTLAEIGDYLDNRAAKGFTVIQAVALAEYDGLRIPNRYGQVPFHNLNPDEPNDEYFSVIDSTVHMARALGLFIGLLPTWGDKVSSLWGTGPIIFDSANAYRYGKWLGNRYKKDPNIIWILGGDRPAVKDTLDWRPIWRQMAKGIIEATNHHCLIGYHPWGGPNSTSQWLGDEAWLDINMFQSGHGGGHDVACWELVTRDRKTLPGRPTLDAEPNYEDHPVNPWPKWDPANGYYRAYDVRKQLYRSVFAGGCGVTYGHHAVWQFMSAREEAISYPDRGYLNALDRPGAFQAGYLRRLIESRPMAGRLPDSNLVQMGQGLKGAHMEAFAGADSSYAMVYFPIGKSARIRTGSLKGANLKLWWYNPRDGSSTSGGAVKKIATLDVACPTEGIENDWVLLIDDADKQYPAPGLKTKSKTLGL